MLSSKNIIMIVDDESDFVYVTKKIFKYFVLSCIGFTDPIQAAEYFKANFESIDVLVSDIRMPKINGFQLADIVVKVKPEVKIIFMAYSDFYIEKFQELCPVIKVRSTILRLPVRIPKIARMIMEYHEKERSYSNN